jgi:phage shock protein PspC (stress-responsive transcriptional regulator)
MNKTVSINLGGFFFHIDEDAYQKLSRYFEAVKRSLSPEGRDEIMKDIESRVAEIFQGNLKNEKSVIGLSDIDEVISIMGQPEDYQIDDNPTPNSGSQQYYSTNTNGKKIYRDKDNAILGGVLSGLGHYVGVDPLWLRLLMVVLIFGFGTGILVYLILWILIPAAETTAQKLEMRGEPITISNIEKKVKEGFDEINGKINNLDHQKIAAGAKTGADKVASAIGEILTAIFKAVGKIIGAFIFFFAAMSLIGILVGSLFMIFSATMPDTFIFNHISSPFNTDVPLWLQGILLLLSIGIPLFFFLILGLKLLISNMKSIGNYVKYTLLAIWIISLASCIYLGIKQYNEIGYNGKTTQKEQVSVQQTDTLYVKMRFNDFFAKNVNQRERNKLVQDENNNEIIYSNSVRIHLMHTDETVPFVQIEKEADGKSYKDAKSRAEKINYNFDIQGNRINLDNYFTTAFENKFRNQEVHVYLYLPEGTVLYPDESISKFLSSHNSDIDIYYGKENYYYKVNNKEMECLNCPNKDNDEPLDENLSIKLNNKEIQINVKEDGVNIQTK